MYCPKCGSEVADGAKFCPSCGMSIASAPAQAPQPPQPTGGYGAPQSPYAGSPSPSVPPVANSQYQPVANPQYQTMGGWFLFFLICFILSGIYLVVNGVQGFGVAGQLGTLASLVGMGWIATFLYVASVVMIICAVLLFYACYLAFSRQPGFLKVYQIMRIVDIVSTVILAILYGMMYLSSVEIWSGAVGSVIGLILMTLYFCKSVRVRTYMGSEAYMDQALFTIGR